MNFRNQKGQLRWLTVDCFGGGLVCTPFRCQYLSDRALRFRTIFLPERHDPRYILLVLCTLVLHSVTLQWSFNPMLVPIQCSQGYALKQGIRPVGALGNTVVVIVLSLFLCNAMIHLLDPTAETGTAVHSKDLHLRLAWLHFSLPDQCLAA